MMLRPENSIMPNHAAEVFAACFIRVFFDLRNAAQVDSHYLSVLLTCSISEGLHFQVVPPPSEQFSSGLSTYGTAFMEYLLGEENSPRRLCGLLCDIMPCPPAETDAMSVQLDRLLSHTVTRLNAIVPR